MTYLVTGATGLLGNNVVRQLIERGETPRVLVRKGFCERPFQNLNVELCEGDLNHKESLAAACKGVDHVIHCAGYVHIGWTRTDLSHAVNVEGAQNVAIAAKRAGAKMVHVSSINALGIGSRDTPANEETPLGGNVQCGYVVTKRESEEAVRSEVADGLNACIVNPGFMLGPWDWKPSSGKMVLQVAKNFTPVGPHGGFSVCDVRDVAAGVLSAAEKGTAGRGYILAGENMLYFDLWKMIAKVSGGSPPWIRPRGPYAALLGGYAGDFLARLTGNEGDLNSAGAAMSNQYHYYCSKRAENELQYKTRPVVESLQAEWDWLKEYGYA